MTETTKIPCRVCGKLFTPCAYCQSHSDIFRWRNFACSRECALTYINDTVSFRASRAADPETPEKKETRQGEATDE